MALDSHLTPSTWCGLITCRRAHARQAVVSKLDAMEVHSDVSACAGSRLRQRQGRRWRDCGLRRREAGQHAGTPSRGEGRCRHVGTPPQGGAPARRPARQRRPGRPTAPLEDHLQVEARRSQWGARVKRRAHEDFCPRLRWPRPRLQGRRLGHRPHQEPPPAPSLPPPLPPRLP